MFKAKGNDNCGVVTRIRCRRKSGFDGGQDVHRSSES